MTVFESEGLFEFADFYTENVLLLYSITIWGINGLLPFVSEYACKISLEDLNGKVCGMMCLDGCIKELIHAHTNLKLGNQQRSI